MKWTIAEKVSKPTERSDPSPRLEGRWSGGRWPGALHHAMAMGNEGIIQWLSGQRAEDTRLTASSSDLITG